MREGRLNEEGEQAPTEGNPLSAVKTIASHAIEYDRTFLDSLFEGVVSFGQTGEMLFCNKAAEQILRIKKDQIKGLTPMDARWGSIHEDGSPFPGHDHPSMYTLRTGVACKNVVMGFTRPGETTTWVNINSQPVYRPGSLLPDSVTCSFVDITAERLMLDELKKSERIQRLALSSTTSGFYVLDESFHLRVINKAGEAMARTILAKDIVVGDYYPDLIDEDRKALILGYLRNALDGVETTYEINRRKGGKLVYFHVLLRPVFDEAYKAAGVYIVLRDITKEKELREKELQFISFMKNTPTYAWIIDEHHTMRYINPGGLRAYGLTEDVIGRSIKEIFPADICEEYIANNNSVFSEGRGIEFRERAMGIGGEVQTQHVFKFPLGTDGNGVRLLGGVGIDITSLLNAQQALEMSNERYAFACKATSDTIWDWDINQNKIDTKISHVHPKDRNKYKTSIQQALEGNGDFWQEEYRFRTAKGRYRFVLDKGYIIRDKDKKAVRMIGAMQDVTSHRKLESRLLQEAVNNKRAIIQAIVSAQEKEKKEISDELHDNVSQLLATCNLYIDALLNQPPDPDLLRECKALIKTSITELRNISHNLTPAVFEEKGLFATVEEMTEKINRLGTLAIKLHFAEVEVLEKQLSSEMKIALYRIIQEQVKNILRHSEASKVIIAFKASEGNLLLEVADNGKGFELQKLKRGLGLNNIQSRVSLFDGELVIKSSPGKGCVIKAVFPHKARKEGKTG